MRRLAALVLALCAPVVASSPAADAGRTASAASAPSEWHLQGPPGADVRAAQATGDQGAGITVAVVDTWVDHTHPAFGGRVAAGLSCLGGTPSAADCVAGQKPDSCSHGTHVAGTIASGPYGVAPAAGVLPLQVLTDGGQSGGTCSGSLEDVAAAVAYVTNGGHPRASVINLSLGADVPLIGRSSDLVSAVDAAAAAGVVVVFAAGNSSLPITDGYGTDGAGVPDALLVAATGPRGELACYSNSGSVTLAAPGGDTGGCVPTQGTIAACAGDGSDCILSTFPGGAVGLDEGTSMACPHVAGAAALLLARNPSLGRDGVVGALERTAHPLAGAGAGSIDVAAALATVRAPAGPAAATSPASTAAPHGTAPASGPTTSGGRSTPGTPAPGAGSPPATGSRAVSPPAGAAAPGSTTPQPTGGAAAPTSAGPPASAGSPVDAPGSPPATAGGTPTATGPLRAAGGGGPSGPLLGAGALAAVALAVVAAAVLAARRRR